MEEEVKVSGFTFLLLFLFSALGAPATILILDIIIELSSYSFGSSIRYIFYQGNDLGQMLLLPPYVIFSVFFYLFWCVVDFYLVFSTRCYISNAIPQIGFLEYIYWKSKAHPVIKVSSIILVFLSTSSVLLGWIALPILAIVSFILHFKFISNLHK